MKETCDDKKMTLIEQTFEKAIKRQYEQVSLCYLLKIIWNKCSYWYFKYRFEINDHMSKIYYMFISKLKPEPKVIDNIEKMKKLI